MAQDRITVTISTTSTGAEALVDLVERLTELGTAGCSRNIGVLDPPTGVSNPPMCFWDGDGDAKIYSYHVAPAGPALEVEYERTMKALSVYAKGTEVVRVETSTYDEGLRFEYDAKGELVGLELRDPNDSWFRNPDRATLPEIFSAAVDNWLAHSE